MKRIVFALAAAALFSACSNQSASTTATEAPSGAAPEQTATAASSASPNATPSTLNVSYDDLNGVFGANEITQLASLGVFGAPTGHFNPAKPVLRREFVRWLFNANNAIWASDSNNLIHPAQGEPSSFTDIKTSDPDFQYIQGLQDAGISVGFPDKTFQPDVPITHEQAVAIKSALDRGGVDKDFVISKSQPTYGYYSLPDWKDKHDISPEYVGAIATGQWDDNQNKNDPKMRVDNVPRAFGVIAMFHPKTALTRAQAAIMLSKIGPHARALKGIAARSVADALSAPSPSPSP
ncbi:MAG: S-layer homology domain-containing protein [Candidatus Eremiobacteraeota bacterium]|nr:S-layer homology domain-containing protein [Candidatus Eremiobacteraeota bacterium]